MHISIILVVYEAVGSRVTNVLIFSVIYCVA